VEKEGKKDVVLVNVDKREKKEREGVIITYSRELSAKVPKSDDFFCVFQF
jgi:hypothetical protein